MRSFPGPYKDGMRALPRCRLPRLGRFDSPDIPFPHDPARFIEVVEAYVLGTAAAEYDCRPRLARAATQPGGRRNRQSPAGRNRVAVLSAMGVRRRRRATC